MKKIGSQVLKIFPFIIIAVLICFILLSGKELNLETVMSLVPQNLFLAALVLMGLYALKSLSILFPILVLQVAAGMIFPVWIALILNCIGTGIAYTIPYLIGRISGSAATEKLMEKYPKARNFVDTQRNSDSFISFILRAVSCLPADIVSMYLGSLKISYIPYIIWGLIGTLPGLIPATIAGTSIANPKSPAFIISTVATVVISVASMVLYTIMQNQKKA